MESAFHSPCVVLQLCGVLCECSITVWNGLHTVWHFPLCFGVKWECWGIPVAFLQCEHYTSLRVNKTTKGRKKKKKNDLVWNKKITTDLCKWMLNGGHYGCIDFHSDPITVWFAQLWMQVYSNSCMKTFSFQMDECWYFSQFSLQI